MNSKCCRIFWSSKPFMITKIALINLSCLEVWGCTLRSLKLIHKADWYLSIEFPWLCWISNPQLRMYSGIGHPIRLLLHSNTDLECSLVMLKLCCSYLIECCFYNMLTQHNKEKLHFSPDAPSRWVGWLGMRLQMGHHLRVNSLACWINTSIPYIMDRKRSH